MLLHSHLRGHAGEEGGVVTQWVEWWCWQKVCKCHNVHTHTHTHTLHVNTLVHVLAACVCAFWVKKKCVLSGTNMNYYGQQSGDQCLDVTISCSRSKSACVPAKCAVLILTLALVHHVHVQCTYLQTFKVGD